MNPIESNLQTDANGKIIDVVRDARKQELFKKYSIDESHSEWSNNIDNWFSIEVYRVMHNGELPTMEDKTVKFVTDFLDKANSDAKWFFGLADNGSLYLTAKRMVYRYADLILTEADEKD